METSKVMPTHTPGTLYIVIPKLAFPITHGFTVVAIDTEQGAMLLRRGAKNVYQTSAQAYTVCARMNAEIKKISSGVE